MNTNIQINLDQPKFLLGEIKNLINLKNTNIDAKKMELPKLKEHPQISGLYYFDNILSHDEEQEILENIYQQQWLNDLTRRVQHYGYKYDYKKRKINKNDHLGDLPIWSNDLEKKIFTVIKNTGVKLPYDKFDQLIINEYKSKQGISAHVDCVPCFDEGIITVTTGCRGIMTFRKNGVEINVELKRRSVAILTGDARYKWTHEINKMNNKNFTDINPRVSLTFRKCII